MSSLTLSLPQEEKSAKGLGIEADVRKKQDLVCLVCEPLRELSKLR